MDERRKYLKYKAKYLERVNMRGGVGRAKLVNGSNGEELGMILYDDMNYVQFVAKAMEITGFDEGTFSLTVIQKDDTHNVTHGTIHNDESLRNAKELLTNQNYIVVIAESQITITKSQLKSIIWNPAVLNAMWVAMENITLLK